jgi:hypothetical protein
VGIGVLHVWMYPPSRHLRAPVDGGSKSNDYLITDNGMTRGTQHSSGQHVLSTGFEQELIGKPADREGIIVVES